MSFLCAMISSLTLQLVNPFGSGKSVLFQVLFHRDWHVFEMPVFILLGIMGVSIHSYFLRLGDIRGVFCSTCKQLTLKTNI